MPSKVVICRRLPIKDLLLSQLIDEKVSGELTVLKGSLATRLDSTGVPGVIDLLDFGDIVLQTAWLFPVDVVVSSVVSIVKVVRFSVFKGYLKPTLFW